MQIASYVPGVLDASAAPSRRGDTLSATEALNLASDAAGLSDAERAELHASLRSVRELCMGARTAGVALLLDAEQSGRQPAIRLIARALAAEFNRSGTPPLIYDTHQCYLRGAEARLRAELSLAAQGGYTLAVKLVRGAYRAAEVRKNAQLGGVQPGRAQAGGAQLGGAQLGGAQLGRVPLLDAQLLDAQLLDAQLLDTHSGGTRQDACVLQSSKEATDAEYDACAALLLDETLRPTTGADDPPAAAVLLATHNRASVRAAVARLDRSGQPRDHERVHFAQILGMADDVTLTLGLDGYNALKLVPFGAFGEVLPWLLRRLEENQDGLAAAAEERPLLRAELGRRVQESILRVARRG